MPGAGMASSALFRAAPPAAPSSSPAWDTHHSLHVGRRGLHLAAQAVVPREEQETLLPAQGWGGRRGQACLSSGTQACPLGDGVRGTPWQDENAPLPLGNQM